MNWITDRRKSHKSSLVKGGSMSEWVTDRRPTEDDGISSNGCVWVQDHEIDIPYMCHHTNVGNRLWMPIKKPEPYQPPQPDTSLAASIERFTKYGPQSMTYDQCRDDLDRILEAAKNYQQSLIEFAENELGYQVDLIASESTEPDKPPKNKDNRQDKRWHPDCKCGAIGPDECACKCGIYSDKPKRREIYRSTNGAFSQINHYIDDVKYREVLPTDPADLDALIQWANAVVRCRDDQNLFMKDDAKTEQLASMIERLRDALKPKGGE